jgi:coenzyme F420-reducing hydrogenase beta subunit
MLIKQICVNKEKCTGCAACYSICPSHCISFIENEEGFLYPRIDGNRCIECNLCTIICPVNKDAEIISDDYLPLPGAFAVMAKDKAMLAKSASGGLFGILAQLTIQDGGVVFGAVYDESFRVMHIMAETWAQVTRMQGSKYVQSAILDTYLKAQEELKKGRKVLFTGTPCQIAGLKSYLRTSYPNLTTVDILCHGVPNQKLFSAYLSYMEAKNKAKVKAYSFRDKEKWGWGSWGSIKLEKQNGKYRTLYFPVSSDYFYSLYFEENCFRESCYLCPFAKLPRQGDFSIGDFWGAEHLFPEIQHKRGVSLMLVNTFHAQQLFSSMETMADIIPCELSTATANNLTIEQATSRPDSRDTFFKDINEFGFETAAKKYCRLSYFVPIVSRYLPRVLKDTVKRVLGKQ